ncbi:transposase [Streptomyces stelliscabiei]|nr:transposase [Streptomyces stelliscabiei]MDX2557916.1 transposase [Streptomyces stelliscabiei]MDX2617689.1 transposase [Streptomyces stelliscabiei]MDX2641866.1 transposase [Streptomyces stelliscabiei]MDX2667563.1 transposase [Streptomyces stelliscabiei]MDX2718350.1 transposase [Streptomyces stelliscabiei]
MQPVAPGLLAKGCPAKAGWSPRRELSGILARLRRGAVTACGHARAACSCRPSLCVLLVAAYGRTNLTLRQLAPLFRVSKSAADRIIDHIGPALALQQRRRFRKDAVLIVDGTLVPTRDHSIAEQSKNYRYSTNHQVVIDADTRLVVAVGRPLPGNRDDCKAWELSGAKAAVGKTRVIADGGYRGTGLVLPHRREAGQSELEAWKEEHNASHRKVRSRVEHAFARMKTWKILRDCRLKGDGVHHAMLGIARLHNLTLAG